MTQRNWLRLGVIVLILSVMLIGYVGCSKNNKTVPTHPMNKSVTLPPSTTTTGIVPKSLSTIEEQAEDIIDIAPNGDWTKIRNDVDSITTAWATYQT